MFVLRNFWFVKTQKERTRVSKTDSAELEVRRSCVQTTVPGTQPSLFAGEFPRYRHLDANSLCQFERRRVAQGVSADAIAGGSTTLSHLKVSLLMHVSALEAAAL